MEVYGKPGGVSEVIKDSFEAGGRRGVSFANDESVVGILENGARARGGKGVRKLAIGAGVTNKTLEDVSDDDKKVGGEGVSLPEAITTSNPVARHPVEEHSRMPGVEDTSHPAAPPIIETAGFQNREEAVPVDRVEGFPEVNFKHERGRFSVMAAPKDVCGIHNILGDSTTRKEAGLVRVDKSMDGSLESCGEDFGNGFHDAILEGNRPEEGRVVCRFGLREEDQKGTIDTSEINGAFVEGLKHRKDIGGNSVPEGMEEGGAKTVRSGARVFIHAIDSLSDFFERKRGGEIRGKTGVVRVKRLEVEMPGSRSYFTQQVGVVSFKDGRFIDV
jgi:hypothetical protein